MTDAWARSISPADAAVALRSYPRRWDALLASAPEDGGDEVLRRRPADGSPSVLEHLATVEAAVRAAGDTLRVTVPAGSGSVEGLRAVAEAVAAAVDAVDAGDWGADTLEAVRAAVITGSERLRTAEATLRQVVGRP